MRPEPANVRIVSPPRELLGTATTPDGGAMKLECVDGEMEISIDGVQLMSSQIHGSERAMARVACEQKGIGEGRRVFVGGLGLGYALRAVLDRLPPSGEVVCVELMPAIAEWNRDALGELAGHPLRDPRVNLVIGDVVAYLSDHPVDAPPDLDSILLDVDNGPTPLTVVGNYWLYAAEGLAALRRRVRPGGTIVFWSAMEDTRFAARMEAAGFETQTRRVSARTGRRAKGAWKLRRSRRKIHHVLFVGKVPGP